ALRIPEIRRERLRFKNHPLRHMIAPALHRGAKQHKRSTRRPQMCREGKPIGASADDDDVLHGLHYSVLFGIPRLLRTPTGVKAISRWLSEAIPPVKHPGLIDPGRGRSRCDPYRGRKKRLDAMTGGIASLNHRLIASTPPGCKTNCPLPTKNRSQHALGV